MQKLFAVISESLKDLYDQKKVEKFIDAIEGSKKIFCSGIGRSGLVARAFAMRLMHLGYEAYVIGETITPRIEPRDLLIAVSGSGETPIIVAFAKKTKEIGAKVVAVTSKADSSIAKIADLTIVLKSKFGKEISKFAPLGTLFEITALIFLDGIVAEIMEKKNISEDKLARRHSIENEVGL
ncbi:MAG: 6-phospho-3-hexuloisomerase [Archaeoglobi archaeon]|jgi:6-phospho-3-hexuloisomerase|nr:MAG: 6-phospho-3-hexuloisomerase [Archaeoglobi archaeon]TDA28387.1 MAG: 6-phospho-3-hexuloisomerase [Archaeoglobi archaeon]